MSIIRVIEYRAFAYFIVRILEQKKIKKIAQRAGKEINKILDERYKEKKSELLQAQLIDVFNMFVKALAEELRKDWPNLKKEA